MHPDDYPASEQSFAAWFQSYYPLVRAVARRIVRDEQTAEDLAQDVFAKAYVKSGTLRDAGKIKPWLLTMIRRRAIDWMRQQQRQPEREWLPDELQGPDKLEEAYICREQLHEALRMLDEPYRQAFLWHAWRGYTAREIGLLTQQSANTVDSRIRRARGKLRHYLESLESRRVVVPVAKPTAVRSRLIVPDRAEFEMRLVSQSILAVMLRVRQIRNG